MILVLLMPLGSNQRHPRSVLVGQQSSSLLLGILSFGSNQRHPRFLHVKVNTVQACYWEWSSFCWCLLAQTNVPMLLTCRLTQFEPVIRNDRLLLVPLAQTGGTHASYVGQHSSILLLGIALFADAFWLIKMHPRFLFVKVNTFRACL